MKEEAIQFGPDRRLLGLLTVPDDHDPARPAILIPNTGVEHRAGPNRLHVHLARSFAARGFATLRMDLSGMGDSGSARDLTPANVVADQQCALDELQRLGVARRFVPVGICSGANDVHWLAGADERMAGVAFVDHYTYPTLRYYLTFAAQRLCEPRRLRNYMERKLREATQGEKDAFRGELVVYLEQPTQHEFSAQIAGFTRRKLPLFFLFTGEYQHLYNYREQLLDSCAPLRGYDRCDLHYLARCDHTFTQAPMREQLTGLLGGWLQDRVLPILR